MRDAVTQEAEQLRRLFSAWGWGGRDYAARVGPGTPAIRPIEQLDAGAEDVFLLHHSAFMPGLGKLLALPNPKLLLYHNITPAQYLWEHAPLVASQCAVGRGQLPHLVAAVDVTAAHSEFNARELADVGAEHTEVIPLFVDLGRLGPQGRPSERSAPPVILFVGRLSPHKGQEELITAFALYRKHRAPGARLVLIGERLSAGYTEHLRHLADDLAPGAVTIETGLSAATLADRYRSASTFVCLSHHEGFCAPLLEAFHADLPVITRPSGAIPEVVGDAALLVEDDDPAVIAELIDLAVTDPELRSELIRRGRSQLQDFSPELTALQFRATVEAAARLGHAKRVRTGQGCRRAVEGAKEDLVAAPSAPGGAR